MRIVVIGATSLIAQHCARQWAARADEFWLVGRNHSRLLEVAQDLQIRNPKLVCHILEGELLQATQIQPLIKQLDQAGPIDLALVAHGELPDQAACQENLEQAQQALQVNGLSPVLWLEGLAGLMQRHNQGSLVVLGSVAGDRGRRSNYLYGAAKGLVEHYVQGLQHRLAESQVRVILVKPGPTATPMTVGRRLATPLADVGQVAEAIVTGIAAGKPVFYAPAYWGLVMMVLRHLPRFIFNRLPL